MKKFQVPRKNPKVTTKAKDDELMLLNTETAGIIILNFVAGYIWSLIDGVRTLDEIVSTVNKKFPDATIKQIRQDVQKITQELASKGFIL